ncbi:MAG: hypothetical protein ABR992_01720 [Solirubrobacteraceae bacterium]|jgi:hypothetical protein
MIFWGKRTWGRYICAAAACAGVVLLAAILAKRLLTIVVGWIVGHEPGDPVRQILVDIGTAFSDSWYRLVDVADQHSKRVAIVMKRYVSDQLLVGDDP